MSGRLAPTDQHCLREWLNHNHPRVISTSPASILPIRPCAGLFLESLYYRLNTVCLDARALPPDGG